MSRLPLIGEDLHERDPRGIVAADMDELRADAVVAVDRARISPLCGVLPSRSRPFPIGVARDSDSAFSNSLHGGVWRHFSQQALACRLSMLLDGRVSPPV